LAAEETSSESDDDSSLYETTSEDEGVTDSSEGSDDSEESTSEESIPKPKMPVRSQTTRLPPRSAPTPEPRQPAHRAKSLSLRPSRSMNFSLSQLSSGRHSPDIPPVPPIPSASKNAIMTSPWSSKPLPPRPSSQSSKECASPTPSRLGSERGQVKQSTKGKARQAPVTLKPPDLHHIPRLLPIFVEMMRPLLLPRQSLPDQN